MPTTGERTYSFMTVKLLENDVLANEKFFIDGRLPRHGETVELVYVGDDADGALRLQLRVKNAGP